LIGDFKIGDLNEGNIPQQDGIQVFPFAIDARERALAISANADQRSIVARTHGF